MNKILKVLFNPMSTLGELATGTTPGQTEKEKQPSTAPTIAAK